MAGLRAAGIGTFLLDEKALVIVPGAGHLFEEPGTLDEVVRHATDWFLAHLTHPQQEGAHVQA